MSVVTKNTEMVLRQFAERVIKAARLNLGATRTITYNDGKKKRRRQVSTGKLKNSLDYSLLTGVHLLMSFTMEDYGKYLDEGVSGLKHKVKGGSRFAFGGKQPPKGSIRTWMAQKKVKAKRPQDQSLSKAYKECQINKKIRRTDRAAFLISRSIKQRGIPKSEFFQEPFRLEFSKLPEEVQNAVSMDVDEFLKFTKR